MMVKKSLTEDDIIANVQASSSESKENDEANGEEADDEELPPSNRVEPRSS